MYIDNLLHKTVIQIALVILGSAILQFAGRRYIGRIVRKMAKKSKPETILDRRKRENTIITIVSTTYAALIWITSAVIVLTMLGVNVSALLTGAGLIGVIVGLSVQSTIKDLLAGMFILLEEQYRVGDVITLSGGSTGIIGATGKVEEITLRITQLLAFDGSHITIRNGEPTVIVNQTFSSASVLLDISVTYDSDIEAVQKVMNSVGATLARNTTWKDRIKEPIQFMRIDNFTDTGVVIRASGTVAPASQWEVAGEYRRQLLIALSKQPKVHLAHS